MEANEAKIKIAELKEKCNFQKKEEMRIRHSIERKEIERAQTDEFAQFNDFWDSKLKQFEDDANKAELELLDRQK